VPYAFFVVVVQYMTDKIVSILIVLILWMLWLPWMKFITVSFGYYVSLFGFVVVLKETIETKNKGFVAQRH
jgi:hypothetical protein